ncbi:DENN domain-containing [Brachionus plicatilis]|uniref:DENN domain-containing n=1 Tax=Brachionus plicatilis TaxID=10195 RepID=A0A3M7T5M3_BRAPC|nr:DENN domain-containing [Brachionus plicatilis]
MYKFLISLGKSALWNHLSNYRKLIQYLHPNPLSNLDPKSVPPTLQWCLLRKRATIGTQFFQVKSSQNRSSSSTEQHVSKKSFIRDGSTTLPRKRVTSALTPDPISQRISPYMTSLNRAYVKSTSNLASLPTGNHKRAVSSNGEPVISLCPLKNDLLADLARIDKLTEVKTEIGLARAFVRLSLEKKLLADHLRQLLSEAELLRALYKKHAFLRQEEEREQFIYHLQSLNVVDYFCFTNHFKSMPTDYLVMIVPSKKFNSSTTSANPYMKLFGSLAESDVTLIPKNSFELIISCKNNLGPLTSLVIGHDNAGITPKWMIECLFVRNEITGHIDRFPCGRWLGKGVDDDSLERLLIAEPLDFNETYDLTNLKVLSPFNPRSRSPTVIRSDEKKLPSSAIQEMIGDTINTLVKYFEKPETEKVSHIGELVANFFLVFLRQKRCNKVCCIKKIGKKKLRIAMFKDLYVRRLINYI